MIKFEANVNVKGVNVNKVSVKSNCLCPHVKKNKHWMVLMKNASFTHFVVMAECVFVCTIGINRVSSVRIIIELKVVNKFITFTWICTKNDGA